ncbi:MAG: PH domain-containing protein [Thermoleophilaceae bacterium]
MDLSPGESVIFSGRPSWRSILGFYIVGLIVAVAAGAIGWFAAGHSVGVAIGVGVFLIALVVGFFKRFFTKYTITTRRLRVQRGVLRRQIQETRIDRLQDHTIRQTLIERMLKVGTVDFDTSGEQSQGDMFRFDGVANPESVVLDIDRVVRHAESGTALPGDAARD